MSFYESTSNSFHIYISIAIAISVLGMHKGELYMLKGFMRKLHRSFTPSFGLALATPSLLHIFFIESKSCHKKILLVLWTDTQFYYLV